MPELRIYDRFAHYYDAIYGEQDHAAMAEALHDHVIARHPDARTLLEAACGTGLVLQYLRDRFTVAGFDLSPEMITIASGRLPGVPLRVADMLTAPNDLQYDVVVCVGSSIGYVGTIDRLRATVARLARILTPGGLLLIEPWFPPEVWEDGRLTLDVVDRPELKVSRLAVSRRQGALSTLNFDFLVGHAGGVERFAEQHELGLFTDVDMQAAFTSAGMTVDRDPDYPTGRGLYVGQLPAH